MRIWNKPRGSGKTTRMLYASEYTGNNILTDTIEHATMLENKAKQLGLKIPKVLCVRDYLDRVTPCSENIIIDEAIYVLDLLIKGVRPGIKVSDATLTCYEGVRDNGN